ncbi:hypothetical protein PMAYCL1PPCAC_28336, partial [Pristionchus mayeri]
QTHSGRSSEGYKFYLYQIVAWPFISQFCTLLGPVFVVPIFGSYHCIDFTDNPVIVHGIMCLWMLIVVFDIESILDGFKYRLRVLLWMFHPALVYNPFWIELALSSKLAAIIFVGWRIAPIGQHLKREEMRKYLVQDINRIPGYPILFHCQGMGGIPVRSGFRESMVILSGISIVICCYGTLVVSSILILMHVHKDRMSVATKRLHGRFISQLSLQALVPFVVLFCPIFALGTLIILEFHLRSNLAGYVIIVFLITHAPLTSIMTISQYKTYQ